MTVRECCQQAQAFPHRQLAVKQCGWLSYLGQALAENSNQRGQEQDIGQDDEQEHKLVTSISIAFLSSDRNRMRLRQCMASRDGVPSGPVLERSDQSAGRFATKTDIPNVGAFRSNRIYL